MLPVAGLSDQVTAVLDVPETEAVRVWVCDGNRVTLAGASETLTGVTNDTVAFAETAGSATLVAVAVTVCGLAIEAGAV